MCRGSTLRRLLVLALLTAAVVAVIGAGSAGAAPPQALVNGDTVSGGIGSMEAQEAIAAGFNVTVVSGATWDSMSQADFAGYQLLVIGDPTCSSLAASATSNYTTWAPVVMGTAGGNTKAGNRILIGTDPVFHTNFTKPQARHIIHDGIRFAGAIPGRTGLYFDDSCGDFTGENVLSALASLSTGSGTWTENHGPPCGASASLIASNPAFSTTTSADLQGWFCSVHESFPTYASDWSPLAVATDTPTHPTCGNDIDTGQPACGEAYILIAGDGIVTTAPDISVTPLDQTQPAGTSATVTAHVEQAGAPLVGQVVSFDVSGQNGGATGVCLPVSCATNATGDVSFTYNDGAGAGDDTVTAGFTSGGTHEQASAVVHWIGHVEEPISARATSFSAVEGNAYSGAVATVTDPDATTPASDLGATIDWGDGSPIDTGTVAGSGGSYTVAGSHTYADEGSYTVTVTVTDLDSPTNTASATSSATVSDAPLSAAGGAGGNSLPSFSGTTATFTDGNPGATVADFTASIDWGDGNTSSGTVSASGGGFAVDGTHGYAATGPYTVTTTITDDGGSTATASMRLLVYAFAPGGGAFVVGDGSATGSVSFWGPQWYKVNSLSGGAAPSSFKGFALNVGATSWSTDPGNSAPPPAGPLPEYMGVIVTSSTSKSGSQISGNIVRIVIVHTNPGYAPAVGHAGTGTAP